MKIRFLSGAALCLVIFMGWVFDSKTQADPSQINKVDDGQTIEVVSVPVRSAELPFKSDAKLRKDQ